MEAKYNANTKRNRETFYHAEAPKHPAWPEPKGTAPRLGGQMGRCVRNDAGETVTLAPEAAE